MDAELVGRLSRLGGISFPPELVVHAPLRICPLGAHIDHQGGPVTGMSVDLGVTLVCRSSEDAVVVLRSAEFPGEISLDLESSPGPRRSDWGDYARAALFVLQTRYALHTGFRGALSGDLPGAGLSSSAALLTALITALAEFNSIALDRKEKARLVQEAENTYLGLASGLLDPSIILFAGKGKLTRVDCSRFAVRQISFPGGNPPLEIIVAFSGHSRKLAAGGYNSRVRECREAARLLLSQHESSGLPRLGDCFEELFRSRAATLPPILRRRAEHYFGESRRVEEGCLAWEKGDLEAFGALVNLSGISSVENYESGTPELHTLDTLLREAPGVYGARFSGGGFGGCSIALARPGSGEAVMERVAAAYRKVHPEAAQNAFFTICHPSGPAGILRQGAF